MQTNDQIILRHIEKGTSIDVFARDLDAEYQGLFFSLVDDETFLLDSPALYQAYAVLGQKTLHMQFSRGAHRFSFSGIIDGIQEKTHTKLVQMIQKSEISVSSRRKYIREELEVFVQFHKASPELFKEPYRMTNDSPALFAARTFDISIGGACVISNQPLHYDIGATFIVEFVLNQNEVFLLPAILRRKGNCPQTVLYKFDYGFQFELDHLPVEQRRLSTALFQSKLKRMY